MASFPSKVRIGTRGSLLATWQSDFIAGRIRALDIDVEIIIIQTTGDLDQRSPFTMVPDKGLFVKELEQALLDGRIDLAVHSLKDLPTSLPEGLMLAAVPEREDPRDVLISRNGLTLEALPAGATVATGSLRRGAQILALRPDLQVAPLRGNVPTRIEKIRSGQADATLLAKAGLNRLGFQHEIAQVFAPDQVTPAMGQGALGIESRAGEFADLWAALEHPPTRVAVDAERRFLSRVEGGCRMPVGILVQPAGEGGAAGWRITGMLASPDGRQLMRRQVEVPPGEDPTARADALALQMVDEAPAGIKAALGRHLAPPEAP